jgi:hypothetical protein
MKQSFSEARSVKTSSSAANAKANADSWTTVRNVTVLPQIDETEAACRRQEKGSKRHAAVFG